MVTLKERFETYFQERFSSPTSYRGHHFFQHSRYTEENIDYVLKFIDKFKNKGLNVPAGDHKDYKENGKYCNKLGFYTDYVELTIKYKQEFKKTNAQFNSIKKHLFPDLERMGFITRSRDKSTIWITNEGNNFINESNPVNKQMKWSRGLIRVIKSKCPSFIDSLVKLLELTGYITQDELFYFVSYLDFNEKYDYKNVSELIEYSRNVKFDYNSLKREFIVASEKSLKDDKPKNERLDYQNFTNASTSLWNYLQELIYFETINVNSEIRLVLRNTIQYGGKELEFRRDPKVKTKYLEKHGIIADNSLLFDFHHIIPLYLAGTVEEKILLDNWKNIICIDQNTHAVITRKKSDHIVVEVADGEVLLYSYQDDESNPVIITNQVNAVYNADIIKENVKEYNIYNLKHLGYLD